MARGTPRRARALLALAVAAAAVALAFAPLPAAAAAQQQTGSEKAKPITCPPKCLSCVRTRKIIKPQYQASRKLQTAPLRTQWTQCDTGYAPSNPAVRCDCAPGHAAADKNSDCVECAPDEVAPQGPPGRYKCKPCVDPKVPNADKSKCVSPQPPTTLPGEGECIKPNQCPSPLDKCGTYTQCGVTIVCGTCPDGFVCALDRSKCIPEGQLPCIPATSCPAGVECGSWPDGCGGTITCGDPLYAGNCAPGEVCTDERKCVVVPPTCTPKTKCDYKKCGFEDDRCGGTVSCGTCPDGQQCLFDGLTCVGPSPCVPDRTTCDPAMKCGTQDNGCGQEILCGECNTDQGYYCQINEADMASECQLVVPPPTQCAENCTDQKCGVQTNNCGEVISCGSCPFGQACAADGQSCQPIAPPCIPLTTCFNQTCGTQGDGCGGEIVCGGPCAPDPGCPQLTPEQACEGRVCGTVGDGCGGLIQCGSCTPGYSCSSDGATCSPPVTPCTPKLTCSVACGPEPDGCGGVLNCGGCDVGSQCINNQCVAQCSPILGPCKNSTDCCYSSSDTFCQSGVCKVRDGGRCSTNGQCGLCHPNCGSNTVSETCAAYGIFSGQCNHAAVAGGGKECGNTFVCCVITKPTPIPVGTDGFCGT